MTVETMMEEINSVDLRYPIIVYKKSLFEYIIIDGNHRLEKSARLGLKNIYVKFISKKELTLINDNSVLEYLME
jgi:ParB-like chromosome segregation protein Spo0J